jgi:hypothetical protein
VAAAGLARPEHTAAAGSELPAEAPGFYSFKLGKLRIAPVCDGVFYLPMKSSENAGSVLSGNQQLLPERPLHLV